MMEMDRIKWDEGMMTRCLSRLTDAYPQPAKTKRPIPEKTEEETAEKTVEKEFILEFDIPAADPVAYTKPAQKTGKWDDFKKAIDLAL